MKRDKILLNISVISDIKEYEKLGVKNFLFPLKGFSVGYEAFTYDEIEATGVDAYILVNKLLTDDDIDKFMELTIPKNVLGFIIEDTGLYIVLKDSGYRLINFQNHLNANYKTVNYWLGYFESLVISTDITKEEIETIIDKASKPLVLNTFGYPMIMYSRRHLVSNYYQNFALEPKKEVTIEDPKGEFAFRLCETDEGTACFDTHILDAREIGELSDFKILFYLYNSADISLADMKKAIEGIEVDNTTRGFLAKKTVYKIGDLK